MIDQNEPYLTKIDLKITIIDVQNEIKFHQIIDLTIALKIFLVTQLT